MPRHTQRRDLPPSLPRLPQGTFGIRAAVGLGLLVGISGCQTSGGLANLFKTPKPTKSIQSLVDSKKGKAGLPQATKAKTDSATLAKSLDAGQTALGKYYQETSHTSQQAHLTEASRNYVEALKADPHNSEAHHGLAIISDLKNDYTTAELHYRAALEQDPDNSAILGDLGYSFLLQGKLAESEQFLRQATQQDAGNTQAMKNLACVYGKQGQYNLAESTFRRVLNDGEVQQEMSKLFPNGRPDVAENERKGPWLGKNQPTTPTTEALQSRLEEARQKDLAAMTDRRSTLEKHTEPQLTIEQMKAKIAELEAERDFHNRSIETQTAANSPLVIGDGSAHPGMQIHPQTQAAGQSVSQQIGDSGERWSTGSPSYSGPRKATNSMYPNGVSSPFPGEIQQAGNQVSPWAGDQTNVQQALHQTKNQIDPRTGLPRHDNIQQTQGQTQGLQVPNTYGQSPAVSGATTGSSPTGPYSAVSNPATAIEQYEAAKRRAAMVGMGGPELMFPVVESTQRIAPGTGSTYNGGQYPAPPRYLPMDAAPHDLNQLMNSPSGQFNVQPNDKGQLNSPTGASFQNPNLGTRLQPEIPVNSPMGQQSLYQDQAYAAQSGPTAAIAPATSDPRAGINSGLYTFGNTNQYNPSQFIPSANSQIPTPSVGVPQNIQAPQGRDLMSNGWNPQTMNPQMMPPPYPGRPAEQGAANGGSNDYRPNPVTGSDTSAGSSSYYSEPAPIYSPGTQSPPDYRARNTRQTASDFRSSSNSEFGPRITPSR